MKYVVCYIFPDIRTSREEYFFWSTILIMVVEKKKTLGVFLCDNQDSWKLINLLISTNITQESKRYQMSRPVSGQLTFFGLHQRKIVLREILSKYIRDLKKYVQTQQMFEFTFFSWCLNDFFGFTLNPATQSLQFLSHLNDYELRYWLQPLPV